MMDQNGQNFVLCSLVEMNYTVYSCCNAFNINVLETSQNFTNISLKVLK